MIAIYSHPKSFVNFLLPPLDKGRVGVGTKIYDSCKDCYSLIFDKITEPTPVQKKVLVLLGVSLIYTQ